MLEGRQWRLGSEMIKPPSMVVDFMELKTRFMMIEGGIILENVSSKDPSILYSEMVDLSMR